MLPKNSNSKAYLERRADKDMHAYMAGKRSACRGEQTDAAKEKAERRAATKSGALENVDAIGNKGFGRIKASEKTKRWSSSNLTADD